MKDVVSLTNEWWIKLGLMSKSHDAGKGIDCSLMGDLVKQGYGHPSPPDKCRLSDRQH